MAKTTGPLFSLTASGTVGNTITYSNWKGRPYVRRRVIPMNPKTTDQATVRNAMRCVAAAVHNAFLQTEKRAAPGVVDRVAIAAITPDGYAWNGFLMQQCLGTNLDNYTAAQAAWTVIAANHAAWDTAADGVTPAFVPAAQVAADGVPATPLTNGNVFFVHVYGMFIMGLIAEPGAVPPVYS